MNSDSVDSSPPEPHSGSPNKSRNKKRIRNSAQGGELVPSDLPPSSAGRRQRVRPEPSGQESRRGYRGGAGRRRRSAGVKPDRASWKAAIFA
ncbi:hypothetical protein Cni_G07926 [Canna indica]|uniref:Uncharacterized protein n=1 Tax=Canna indica TaxID=4628 RepID=A0AAQ3JZD9_9LILI|nr:hypothetical protein Cni_G07926 [Canna indica]